MLWVRPLDVARLLTTRDLHDGRAASCSTWSTTSSGSPAGRFALDASPAGATCVDDDGDGRADVAGEGARRGVRSAASASTRCSGPGGSTSTSPGAVDRAGALLAGTRRAVVQHLVLNRAYIPVMGRGLRRIAIVNRGEAAMRLINAVRELRVERGEDIRTIALHTAAERTAMFVREADEAVLLDGTYLDLGALERALVAARADAAWVGWGFVAERPGVRRAVRPPGHHVRRSERRRDAPARRQDRRQAAGRGGGRARRGVERRPGRDAGRGPPSTPRRSATR